MMDPKKTFCVLVYSVGHEVIFFKGHSAKGEVVSLTYQRFFR